jgi:hypothetical protein
MTNQRIITHLVPGSRQYPVFSPHLVDEITDAILSCNDHVGRAQVVNALLTEIYQSIPWLRADLSTAELESIRQIVEQAQAHQARMMGLISDHPRAVAS